jgi:hypothetical protein
MQTQTLYEQDFYAWTVQQTELLRAGRWESLDVENLIEEMEALGRQERRELKNRLGILLGHLLKWRYQPDARSKSWWATIFEQRQEILQLLKENPSLKPYLPEAIALAHPQGLAIVIRETPLTLKQLPESCPFSMFEILEEAIEWEER